MKMNQDDWEDMLTKRVAAFKVATASEQSELNPIGITVHAAEHFAKKYHWEFELIPVYIGGESISEYFNSHQRRSRNSIKPLNGMMEKERKEEEKNESISY